MADFWILGGKKVSNIHELCGILEGMSPRTFSKHSKNNDFHNFVKDVHGDGELAVQLLQVSGRDNVLSLIQKRIAQMEKFGEKISRKAGTTQKMKLKQFISTKNRSHFKLMDKVPSPPTAFWNTNLKREAVISGIIIVILIGVIGLGAKSQITAAIIGGPNVLSKIHFLSVGSIIAILVLLAIAIFVLRRHANNVKVNEG